MLPQGRHRNVKVFDLQRRRCAVRQFAYNIGVTKYDPATRVGHTPDGRKVKATLHWVNAAHAVDAEARLYDKLFTVPEPDAEGDFMKHLNPHSLEVVTAKCEPSLADATPDARYQFERLGYFALDPDSKPDKLVFNRTITLKDTWTKIDKKQK